MGKPAEYNLNEENSCAIYKGADFSKTFTFSYNLESAGITGVSQLRQSRDIDSTLLADFTVTISGYTLTLSLDKADTVDISTDVGYYDVLITTAADFTEPCLFGEVELLWCGTDVS